MNASDDFGCVGQAGSKRSMKCKNWSYADTNFTLGKIRKLLHLLTIRPFYIVYVHVGSFHGIGLMRIRCGQEHSI